MSSVPPAGITWFFGTVRPDGRPHAAGVGAIAVRGVAALYAELGWPATAEGDAITAPYSAPSAGPAPWHLYRFSMRVAFGVATAEPHGATRWRFA
ncbi:hypothetical protein ACIBI9_19370 [Nonomuraea sp. NPDC050451]|uniref:hypothetical protein n=1 Tax=Nonomuraea sp. NPDC050451 TaxID=3364364 RepID=UPI0037989686